MRKVNRVFWQLEIVPVHIKLPMVRSYSTCIPSFTFPSGMDQRFLHMEYMGYMVYYE